MASFTWPATLPQCALSDGFSESRISNIIRTPMDAGVAKSRMRGRRPQMLSAVYAMTNDQLDTFDTFLADTVRYVYRFDIPHPRTGNVVEVRIVPQGDGEVYKIDPILDGAMWRVSLMLEIMP